MFACIWAFGGSLGTDKQNDWRREFDSFWQGAFREIKFPKESSVYDFYFNLEEVSVYTSAVCHIPTYLTRGLLMYGDVLVCWCVGVLV